MGNMDPSYNDAFGNAGAAGVMNAGGVAGSGNVGMNAGGVANSGSAGMNAGSGVGSSDANGMNAGGVMSPDGVMSSDVTGQGDIVINSDDGARKRKILLIVLAVLVGLIVIAGIIFAIVMSGTGQGSGRSGASNYRDAFNIYANYFVYGEQGDTSEVGWYDTRYDDTFFAKSVDSMVQSQMESVLEMEEYYKTFSELYISTELGDNDNMTEFVLNYGSNLNIAAEYYGRDASINQSIVLDEYSSGGEKAVADKVESIMSPYREFGGEYGKKYYDLGIEYGNRLLDLAKKYAQLGCITAGVVDYNCIADRYDDEVDLLSGKASDYYVLMQGVMKNIKSSLYVDLYDMSEIVNGEQEVENDEQE